MALEIERKYLADIDKLPNLCNGVDLCQGYLPTSNLTVARVRLAGAKAFLTIKGPNRSNPETSPQTSNGPAKTQIVRSEFEYEIPLPDARQMLAELCGEAVEKTRYTIDHEGHCWELDVFKGRNLGLVIAEIELATETAQFPLPPWVGDEVSDDMRYFNTNLISSPFDTWGA